MDEAIKIGSSAADQFLHSPVWVFVAVLGMCVGLLIKYVKCIPDRFIPLFVLAVTSVAYGRLGDPGGVPYTVSHPRVLLGAYGFIEGFVVWMLLRQLILKQLDKRFPSLHTTLSQFDTTVTVNPNFKVGQPVLAPIAVLPVPAPQQSTATTDERKDT